MFFLLSKTIGRLVMPSNAALFLLALWALLRWRKRLPRLARWALRLAVFLLLVFSLPAIAALMTGVLERAHSRPKALPRDVSAIVMLGGITSAAERGYEFNAHSDRFVEAVRIAHRLPKAKLLITGGNSTLAGGVAEAPVLAQLAVELGIAKDRILVDDKARNTRENATHSDALLAKHRGTKVVLLVTSALHMPRAMSCFQKVFDSTSRIVAWPTDWQKEVYSFGSFIPRIRGLRRSEQAINEFVGYVAYWLLGYI